MYKKLKYPTITILALFLAVSIAFGLIFRWYCSSIPLVAILLAETVYRNRNKPVHEVSTTSDHLPVIPANLITSISDFLLKDYVTCVVDRDYRSIGTGSPEEVLSAWGNLLSQYQNIKKDPAFSKELMLSKTIYEYEIREAFICLNTEILNNGYCNSSIKWLKKLYPNYLFTKETLQNDLRLISLAEKAYRANYELAIRQMDKSGEDNPQEVTRDHFHYILFEISKLEGVKYDMTISLMEYAILENRLYKHYEFLKDQNAKHGR